MRYDLIMNNASQAPWWFAVVTALIAVIGTLTSAWLTNKYAEKRSQRELANQRNQFNSQLKHHSELERRKLLYDRRADLYAKVMALHTDCIEALPPLKKAIVRYIASDHNEDACQAVQVSIDELSDLRKKLRVLTLELIVIASGKVSASAAQIGYDLRFVITTTKESLEEESFAGLDVDKLTSFPTRLFSECALSMRADLGVVEEMVGSDSMKPTDEDLARIVRVKSEESSDEMPSPGDSE